MEDPETSYISKFLIGTLILEPGRWISGFFGSKSSNPFPEKYVIVPCLEEAPTVITDPEEPGLPIVPGSGPKFPADATIIVFNLFVYR